MQRACGCLRIWTHFAQLPSKMVPSSHTSRVNVPSGRFCGYHWHFPSLPMSSNRKSLGLVQTLQTQVTSFSPVSLIITHQPANLAGQFWSYSLQIALEFFPNLFKCLCITQVLPIACLTPAWCYGPSILSTNGVHSPMTTAALLKIPLVIQPLEIAPWYPRPAQQSLSNPLVTSKLKKIGLHWTEPEGGKLKTGLWVWFRNVTSR